MKIKDILLPGFKTISPEASMAEAEIILKEYKFRHLPVWNGKKLVGIISEKDINRAMSVFMNSQQKKEIPIYRHKKVSDFMSSPVFVMKEDEYLQNLIRMMVDMKVSAVVIENNHLIPIGIITTEDLLVLLLDYIEKPERKKKIKSFFFPRNYS